MSSKENFVEDVHTLVVQIESIEEAMTELQEELQKNLGLKSGVRTRIYKDYLVVHTYVLFDDSKNSISLVNIPKLYKHIISNKKLNIYSEKLTNLLNSNKSDLNRIKNLRNKIIAHKDKDRRSKFGFDSETVEVHKKYGINLRKAPEYAFQYMQSDHIHTIPLFLNISEIKLLLEDLIN